MQPWGNAELSTSSNALATDSILERKFIQLLKQELEQHTDKFVMVDRLVTDVTLHIWYTRSNRMELLPPQHLDEYN